MVQVLLVLFLLTGVAQAAMGGGLDIARQAQQAESRREFEQAARLYTQAIESGDLQPEQVTDALRYRGNVNFFLGRFGPAAGVRSLRLSLPPPTPWLRLCESCRE